MEKNVIDKLRFNRGGEHTNGTYQFIDTTPSNVTGEELPTFYDIEMCGNKATVKEALTQWLAQFDEVEMWSDCLAYDWILFMDIFGHAIYDKPDNVYYIPFDISTFKHSKH